MSSVLVQVTVVPTGTVSVWGPKTKLSIFTAASAAEGWALAVTMNDPNSSIVAIITGSATPAIHTLLFVMVIPFQCRSSINRVLFLRCFWDKSTAERRIDDGKAPAAHQI